MKKRFKVGEIVIYIGKKDGKIKSVIIGKIKKLCKDGAYVKCANRYAAFKINYENLFKVRNLDEISRVNFKRK